MKENQRSHEILHIAGENCRRYIRILSSGGFTAIELILVIVLLGILAVTITNKNPFTDQDHSSIAADQLLADIEYVQLRAMATRSATNLTFFVDPSDHGKYGFDGRQKSLPGSISVTSISLTNPLTFNSLGEPGSSGTISLSGGKTVRVYASTGKAEIE